MQVILLENVAKLGRLGDKVNVKAGYGRNFLIPTGKAVAATENNIAAFEERRAGLEAAAQARADAAAERAARIAELAQVDIAANAGEEGKLFGSIGTRDIADALTAAGIEVSKSEVLMPHGLIRELGEYEVDLQLHPEVVQAVLVRVIAE